MLLPPEIAEKCSVSCAKKTELPIHRMIILSILAGAYIAFGAFGSQVASIGGEGGAGKLMGAIVFPVGLMLVVMAGAELFTGNSLIAVSVLDKKASLRGMLKNWVIVYAGNLCGSIFVALVLTLSHSYSMFDGVLAESVVKTAVSKVSLSFPEAFLKGILCNILVCLAVWISFAAEDAAGKILGLYLPIMLFVISGYEHCVANMYFIPAGILVSHEYAIGADGLTWGSMFVSNLLPVTLGNITGGAVIVSFFYFFAYLKGKTLAS